MGYELKQSDIFDLAHVLGAETRQKGNELFFKWCPYCHGGGNDKDTFSINLDSGFFKCFRAGCGKQGHFVQMARDFHFALETQEAPRRKKYRELPQRPVKIREPALEYLKSRGIGEAVARKYQITTQKGKDNILVFPFYDPDHVLRFVKYRKTDFDRTRDKNKEWCETDTMPILFGMAQCEDFERLVITEGQLDSLSVAEAGIQNAVSVPTGANGFTWLDGTCYEWISKFQSIVIFGDHEHGKITLVEELSRRLPQKLCVVQPEDYLCEKDANDILRKYGPEAVRDAVERAKPVPVRNIKPLWTVKNIDMNKIERFRTNIWELDQAIQGFCFGQLILITGRRGEGKSTFMSQMVLEAMEQGYSTLIYSGELTDYHFKHWMDLQASGSEYLVKTINEYGDAEYSIPQNTQEAIDEWYRDKAYLYDNAAVNLEREQESLLETIEKTICTYGVRAVFVDNLMTAVSGSEELYRSQAEFVKRLKLLAVKYNAVVVLVAHPKKTKESLDNDAVSGASEITNLADVVISYSRSECEEYDSKITVLKNRLKGKLLLGANAIKLNYSQSSKRVASVASGNAGREYSWVKLFKDPQISDFDLPF